MMLTVLTRALSTISAQITGTDAGLVQLCTGIHARKVVSSIARLKSLACCLYQSDAHEAPE